MIKLNNDPINEYEIKVVKNNWPTHSLNRMKKISQIIESDNVINYLTNIENPYDVFIYVHDIIRHNEMKILNDNDYQLIKSDIEKILGNLDTYLYEGNLKFHDDEE